MVRRRLTNMTIQTVNQLWLRYPCAICSGNFGTSGQVTSPPPGVSVWSSWHFVQRIPTWKEYPLLLFAYLYLPVHNCLPICALFINTGCPFPQSGKYYTSANLPLPTSTSAQLLPTCILLQYYSLPTCALFINNGCPPVYCHKYWLPFPAKREIIYLTLPTSTYAVHNSCPLVHCS